MKQEGGQGYICSWTDWNIVEIVPSLCIRVLIGPSRLELEGVHPPSPDKSSTDNPIYRRLLSWQEALIPGNKSILTNFLPLTVPGIPVWGKALAIFSEKFLVEIYEL